MPQLLTLTNEDHMRFLRTDFGPKRACEVAQSAAAWGNAVIQHLDGRAKNINPRIAAENAAHVAFNAYPTLRYEMTAAEATTIMAHALSHLEGQTYLSANVNLYEAQDTIVQGMNEAYLQCSAKEQVALQPLVDGE